MTKLLVGPWAGEFGYELFAWQGRFRMMAPHFDEVIVGCEESSAPLYEDYATEFRYCTSGPERQGCDNAVMSDSVRAIKREFRSMQGKGVLWEPPHPFGIKNSQGVPIQKFRKYGDASRAFGGDVIVHARMCKKQHFGKMSLNRNWAMHKWDRLHELGIPGSVASIGLSDQAINFKDSDDLRGVNLSDVMDHLAGAKVCVGPNSGPIHLAALCGCPIVTWVDPHGEGTGGTTHHRVTKSWNPFNVPVVAFKTLQPKPQDVHKEVLQFLQ